MYFEIGDKVTTATGKVGEIVHYRLDEYRSHGKITAVHAYGVKVQPFYNTVWCKPSELRHLDEFEDGFEQNFELTYLNLMIDKYLDERDFDIVKYYSDFKNEILKCGGVEND